MSEYDFWISYIKRNENVVVDSLSKISQRFSLVPLRVKLREIVLEKLFEDSWYIRLISTLQSGKKIELKFEGYVLGPHELLRFQRRMYIPKEGGIRRTMLEDSNREIYCAHPMGKKMYANMKKLFFLGRHEA